MSEKKSRIKGLPRNIWAVSLTSFFMDISSEMVINLIPLFLSNALGVKTNIIGLIEGVAESTASILKVFSGWLSDKLKARKWPAVLGYALSAFSKPFFYFSSSWGWVAGVRWADRVGKGIRTGPRDALVADSIKPEQRGLEIYTLSLHDALPISLGVVWAAQSTQLSLGMGTFRTVVLVSLVPAFLAVLSLAIGAMETGVKGEREMPKFPIKALGKRFMVFMLIVGLFDLGNSSDAFLVLRAQERGMSVTGILAMLAVFNLVYALVSTPAGALSDRIGREKMIIGGWMVYALVYLGFGLAGTAWHIWVLYILYGLYYGLAYGTAKAMVADLVPAELRGTAYGTYNAVLGMIDLPASLIAGLLWQGIGSWGGFGPSAPFLFGAAMLGAVMLTMWLRRQRRGEKA